MKVEWYAPLVALVGIFLWLRGSVLESVMALLFFSLFGGGAAFLIGGASITPASFALVFVLAHLLLSMFRRSDHANLGVKTNGYLAFFCIYGAIAAYIMPRIFANRVDLPPIQLNHPGAHFVAFSLHFTKQNLTTALYLLGALATSIAAGAAAADPRSRLTLARTAVVIAWLHIGFGVAGSAFAHVGGAEIVKIFRNANYEQLSQSEGGLFRISGIFPEPSAYAGFAYGWFVFMTELWLRDVCPRLTLVTALALGLMLIASTSASAYAALVVYGTLFGVRFLIAPRSVRPVKAVPVAMVVLTLATLTLAVLAFVPHLASTAGHAVALITVGKAQTLSGRERLFWAAAAIKAFKASWGLGVGPGSFRSSGLLLAILGSTGVIGAAAFTGHFLNILKPLRHDTYALPGAPDKAVAVAAAWGACAGLIGAMLSATTPVPSETFAILGGLALGWRYSARV